MAEIFDRAAVFPIIRRRGLFEEICGTGCFAGPDGLVLTCSHLRESAPEASYLLSLQPYDLKELIEIHWLVIDTDLDLAIGHIGDGVDTPCLPLPAEWKSEPGTATLVPGFRYLTYRDLHGGYSHAGAALEIISGTYLRHFNEVTVPAGPRYASKTMPVIVTTPSLVPGFSGAPVLNASGELIGVHSNSAQSSASSESVALSVRLDAIADMIKAARRPPPGP